MWVFLIPDRLISVKASAASFALVLMNGIITKKGVHTINFGIGRMAWRSKETSIRIRETHMTDYREKFSENVFSKFRSNEN